MSSIEQDLPIDGMSQTALGRLKHALNQSSLRVFDNSFDRPGRFLHDVSHEMLTFSTASLEYLNIVLGGSGQYLQNIDTEGLFHMTRRASQLQVESRQKPMIFRTVFGASEAMPLRALSYMLPSIQMAEYIYNLGDNRRLFLARPTVPHVQFVFMINAGTGTNSLDNARCQKETARFVHVATSYIKKFHPDLTPYVSFADDQGFTDGIAVREDFHSFVQKLCARLPSDLQQPLLTMGNGKSDSNESAFYAALHVFVHEGYISSLDFRPLSDKAPDFSDPLIVSFGGAPEKIFHAIRKTLLPNANEVEGFRVLDTAQYITKHTVPPYILLPSYDLSLCDALKTPKRIYQALDGKGEEGVHTVVRKELNLLCEDAGDAMSFVDFLGSVHV